MVGIVGVWDDDLPNTFVPQTYAHQQDTNMNMSTDLNMLSFNICA